MPIKRPPLVNEEIYHIVIRAVEGMNLFRNEKDYFRFLHNLFEFNDENPIDSGYRHKTAKTLPRTVLGKVIRKKREILIQILAFCLMPNHVHLLVKQISDSGISKFMRKIGAGYGIYYNKKYERKGHVFGGKFRAVLVKNDEQLKTLFVYIHTNPVAIIAPKWKEQGIKIKNLEEIIEFLESYKWSSYPDYLGRKNYPSLTNRELLANLMGSVDNSRHFIKQWLLLKKQMADSNFKEILIN
ncbi:transposase [Candidatus Parcubacteria bacterium]|nr:transposase [Candidatus Parcubacteria bacterium]